MAVSRRNAVYEWLLQNSAAAATRMTRKRMAHAYAKNQSAYKRLILNHLLVERVLRVFTQRHSSKHSPIKPKKGDAMRTQMKVRKTSSRVDAWAILFLVILVAAAALRLVRFVRFVE